jgi:hypothetical protein
MGFRFSAVAAAVIFSSATAHAGLINPTSTANITFNWVDPVTGPQSGASGIFDTAAPGPFSLSNPLPPPSSLPIVGYTAPAAPPPIHTTEPYNLSAQTGFFFTNSQVVIYNNASPSLPFCFSSSDTGSKCADPYNTFDFTFTNEDITAVSVASNSSADFAPAAFGSHLGLQLVNANEFTVDVTGDNPAYLSTLIINVTTGGSGPPVPEPSTWAMMVLGFAGLGYAAYRRAGAVARAN